MKCPSCKNDQNLAMSERMGIEIDYCPNCRGVWLDRGELDKIIEKAQADSMAPTSPREKIQQVILKDTDYRPKEFYKQKRKKSFLEELFD